MTIPINPYSVHSPITGPIEVIRDGTVVKTFGDERRASAYAEGRWDGERAVMRRIEKIRGRLDEIAQEFG